MTTTTKISPAVAAATRRAAQYLRPPADQPGQRACHHLHLASLLEQAVGRAILAGLDDIAFKLSALRNEADAAFGADVMAVEMAYLDAEISECDRQLAAIATAKAADAKEPRRRFKPSGSPGDRARAQARKRGAGTIHL